MATIVMREATETSLPATRTATRFMLPEPLVDECILDLSTPQRCDLLIYRGDSGAFRVTVTDHEGNPVDVTTASWDADIRQEPDGRVAGTMTVVPVAAQSSQVDVFLPAAVSADLPVGGPWVWDLEMTLAGVVQTIVAGRVTVEADVSREDWVAP